VERKNWRVADERVREQRGHIEHVVCHIHNAIKNCGNPHISHRIGTNINFFIYSSIYFLITMRWFAVKLVPWLLIENFFIFIALFHVIRFCFRCSIVHLLPLHDIIVFEHIRRWKKILIVNSALEHFINCRLILLKY
jgi:hypothetical protein